MDVIVGSAMFALLLPVVLLGIVWLFNLRKLAERTASWYVRNWFGPPLFYASPVYHRVAGGVVAVLAFSGLVAFLVSLALRR